MNPIYLHKINVSNNIIKAFSVGTVRNWNGVFYKKIADNEWAKIEGDKVKKIADSSVVKNLKNETKNVIVKHNSIKDNYEKFLTEQFEKEHPKFTRDSMNYNVGLRAYIQKYKNCNSDYINQIKNIDSELLDISEEINKLERKIYLIKKEKRERETGLKQIDLIDLKEFLISSVPSRFGSLYKDGVKIKDFLDLSEYYADKKIDSENYYICTNGEFTVIERGENAENTFNKMKDNADYQYTHSPKSTSEYLIDEKNSCVYRIADHWGRCASCDWGLNETPEYHETILAICKFSDLKRNNHFTGQSVVNPDFVNEMNIRIKNNILDMNKVCSLNAEFSKKAKEELSSRFNNISMVVSFYGNSEIKNMFESLVKIYNQIP